MAHFAQVENGTVVNVIVLDNEHILVDGIESEQKGKEFIASLGLGSNWIQTSYNHKFRNKFAGIGDKYDQVNDLFVSNESNANFLDSWQGLLTPTSPSIMFDAVARSANMWTLAVLNKAFPQTFLRWGYISQHRKDSFGKGVENFDITVTVVRNPIDSVASYIVAFGLKNDEDIIRQLQEAKEILDEIFVHKSNINIYRFETITIDTKEVINEIGGLLKLSPEPFDKEAIKESLKSEGTDFYSTPINNIDQLNSAKNILLDLKYRPYLDEAIAAYERVIA
jgi:hypothetical protein